MFFCGASEGKNWHPSLLDEDALSLHHALDGKLLLFFSLTCSVLLLSVADIPTPPLPLTPPSTCDGRGLLADDACCSGWFALERG